jgi:putative FmdB family regulatory protein
VRNFVPNYDFRCKECGHTWEKNVPIADRDNWEAVGGCPSCFTDTQFSTGAISRVAAAPGFSHLIGGPKVPEGFKDVLRNIKKNNVGSLIEVP